VEPGDEEEVSKDAGLAEGVHLLIVIRECEAMILSMLV
jgi:hypothetical protein